MGGKRVAIRVSMIAGAVVVGAPSVAWAGMPAPYVLTDLARLRIEAISFFVAVLLGSAGLVQWVWNGLRGSFTRLPRLNYPRAVGLVVLWGLLFTIVLTMISGARELMTPGAWEQRGATYKLKSVPGK